MVTLFDNFDKTMSHQSQIIAKDHSTGMGFNGHNGSTSEAKQRDKHPQVQTDYFVLEPYPDANHGAALFTSILPT